MRCPKPNYRKQPDDYRPTAQPRWNFARFFLLCAILLTNFSTIVYADQETPFIPENRKEVTIRVKRPEYIQAGMDRFRIFEATRIYDSESMENEIKLKDLPFPCDVVIYYEFSAIESEMFAHQIIIKKVHDGAETQWSKPVPE